MEPQSCSVLHPHPKAAHVTQTLANWCIHLETLNVKILFEAILNSVAKEVCFFGFFF